MVKDVQYVKLESILDRCMRHPLMNNLTLEAVIQYTVDFIGIFGHPSL